VVGAMSSPVVVTSRFSHSDRSLIDRAIGTAPLRELTASDGTEITLWGVDEPAFDVGGDLYVVDGHHRVAAAAQARFDQLFVAYVPPEDLLVDSFDRVVDELAVMPRRVAELLSPYCEVSEVPDAKEAHPLETGTILLQLGGQCLLARRREIRGLDSEFIHDTVLPAAFDITEVSDPRLTYRPSQAVAEDEPVVISSAPVELNEVLKVADRAGVMPPKSTYFVPKARSGVMLVPC